MEVPLKQISYTGGDDRDRKTFGFVASDNATNQYVCFLFKCQGKENV